MEGGIHHEDTKDAKTEGTVCAWCRPGEAGVSHGICERHAGEARDEARAEALRRREGGQNRLGDWFTTYTGVQFYPLDPRVEDVRIEDIAHALANICRFGGHCRNFYSVAQHSVLVSWSLGWSSTPEFALAGLLHDATEAYCGDMVRPLKRALPEYKRIEERIWEAVAAKFGLPVELPCEVKRMDDVLLVTERRDLLEFTGDINGWLVGKDVLPQRDVIRPWGSAHAESYFLKTYADLRKSVELDPSPWPSPLGGERVVGDAAGKAVGCE